MRKISNPAVIFDCDGILVNSEEIACESMHTLLQQLGFQYTREQFIAMAVGITNEEMLRRLDEEHRRLYKRPMHPSIPARLHEHYQQQLKARLRQIPEIEVLLRGLQNARIPYGIATNGNLEGTEWKLAHTGLRALFNHHVYTKDMVQNPKPAPDVYLLAAQRMGMHPKNCFVFEDSEVGVRAAAAAGMTVIGYTGGSHRSGGYDQALKNAGAAFTTASMAEGLAFVLKNSRLPQGPGPRPF